jgi:20S proteasome alpha/beta subunit
LACLHTRCGARVALSFLGSSVSRGARSRSRAIVETRPSLYNEYGQIPQVQNAYKSISHGKQIVTFRTNNSTVVAYDRRKPEQSLLISSGCKPFYMITPGSGSSARHHVLLTGVAGDCRRVVRYLKQLALNHSVEFEVAPTAEYLSTRLGEYLQSHLSGGGAGRMLACHCYLISDTVDNGWSETAGANPVEGNRTATVYEITAVGGVSRVLAGTAGGSNTQQARLMLEASCTSVKSGSSSRALVHDIFSARSSTAGSGGGDSYDREDDKLTPPAYEYIELFDN